jgi:predicted ATPase
LPAAELGRDRIGLESGNQSVLFILVMINPAFITRVAIKNYKSIDACRVELGPLTFLVGPNGSGKSNFLDALRFVRDALRGSLENAIRDRGGINEVRRRSGGHPTHFGVRLDFHLPSEAKGHYAFMVAAKKGGSYEVRQEECVVRLADSAKHFFSTYRGKAETSEKLAPAVPRDRLYMVSVSGLEPFRPVFDALSHMGFYNLNPDVIRDLQAPDSGDLLSRDGGNIASVVENISKNNKPNMDLIREYLSKVVPSVHDVERKAVGPRESLEFRQDVAGSKHPWRFLAAYMSDGTLRALGVLVALFQTGDGTDVPLVGIEEPEVALHPAAVGVLLDALRHASQRTQVLVTSHSADLLDNEEIETDQVLAVVAEGNITRIAPLDEASRKVLRERLYTAGELLRLNQLTPEAGLFDTSLGGAQLELFESESQE